MRKILLFTLALSISIGAMADEKKTAKKHKSEANSKNKIDMPIAPTQPVPVVSADFDFKGTQSVERVYVGKSANIYSVLLEDQRYFDYNQELGTYGFTFRTDPATYPEALNSGNIITATSSDGGNAWTDTWLMNTSDACRYPSGVIYNPDGNTDPAQAYILSCGPVTDGAGWLSNYFATSKVNGEELVNELIPVDPEWSGSQLIRNGLQVCSDGVAHVVDSKYQDNGAGLSTEMNIAAWYAEFNGSGFDWDVVDIPVDLALRTDGTTFNLWTFGNAWSNDGSVGYTWMNGVDAELEGESGYSPIVFRTENQGQDWDQIEIPLEDNEVMSEYLWATNQFNGPMWPLLSEMDGVVDANGDLQLFVKVTGTFSTHPDSLLYSYTGNLDYIYNIEVSADGMQEVMYVDSIVADDVADGSAYGLGDIGWGSRLRATRTEDGSAVFAVWADTDNPDNYEGENGAPNIKTAGRFVNGGSFNVDFPNTNFTYDDLYAGFYFYHNVGQICKTVGNYIQLPVVTSVSPSEFGGGSDLAPVTHSYINGIGYLVDGLEDGLVVSDNSFTVTQNQPNPFSSYTTIELSSNIIKSVMIEVSNLMGQSIYTIDAGVINGTMKVELPANDLEAGIYFYTVTIGNESVTKKMIVE
ncbi:MULTISPECIES: T9SS type A sorting domain-containing protein [unclassified Lentimicrobium]|uniref:T9SS type A sorting domain-containing protein n=1 Tax=unclassified Lentimicrobium TaxID=2677434 RepID=UPI001557003A|nr:MULTISPECIES: T9SS type A sorting domain-containing protein [unclassified Lentimicrobium]NPD47377.1 T9SS type A sorting domain-containing protein [Lentimicrobium sp. S6]NPD86809.1 T9SS type A sorting domain-containing protein [Lentimicrobium sp. L6]